MKIIYLIPLIYVLTQPICVFAQNDSDTVRIGVLAYRGKQEALDRWQPTAQYLTNSHRGYNFEIVPLDLNEISDAIESNRIHFTLTNPGNYVGLETRFGVSRIATLQTRENNQIRVRYGAVIVSRRDDSSISSVKDLEGKSFMAVSPHAFGGFQMACLTLSENGIDPFEDLSSISFSGFPQDKIIIAIRDGVVDAGTVRAETLLRMSEERKINLNQFRILNAYKTDGMSIPLSTRLYPEWPFATLRNTSRELARDVARSLLSMESDHPAAMASKTAGWTVPLDYSPVHELMRTLKIGPYETLRHVSFMDVVKRYVYWFISAGILVMLLLLVNGYIARTNRKLKETQYNLRDEITERKKSQSALARYRDKLEELVVIRTEDLRSTNEALERSRIALRELVRITSAPDLTHEEKIDRLLYVGREYYRLPVAVLAEVVTGEHSGCKCRVSADRSLAPKKHGPLDDDFSGQLIKYNGEPLDIPDLENLTDILSSTPKRLWSSYLGIAVMVNGNAHCTLEFAGTEPRVAGLSQWDHEILKVMAQWIGDELERQIAYDSQQRHQAEFARVSRMSAIGEMATSLAHELNQPLTGAMNYCNGCLRMLRENNLDKDRLVAAMERAVESATVSADIVRNIREFVQKGNAEHDWVNLNDVVRNVFSLVMFEAKRNDVYIKLELDDGLPLVRGNMIELEQVILNFVRNSFDAMDNIKSSDRNLTIATHNGGESVTLITTDAGDGISGHAMPKIFDAFYTTKTDGMGIGLSVSRSIIESHHGKIHAKSLRPAMGAAFSFEIPLTKN